MNYMEKVVENAGGIAVLAREMSVSKATAYSWLAAGFVPYDRAMEIEMRYAVSAAAVVNRKGLLLRLATERVTEPDAMIAAKHGCGSMAIARYLREAGWDGVSPITDEQAELALTRAEELVAFSWDGMDYMK